MILKTDALVLKAIDFRETSRIVTFFTRDHGKITGILKGIRKDHRKFGSTVDRFSVNHIVFYHYRNSEIHLVSQCDLKDFFFPVRQDLEKSLAACYILELVSAIMPAEEKNLKVYELMLDFLGSLAESRDINQLVFNFQIKILLYSGFKPHLDTCLKCRRKITGRARFSLHDGGLVCGSCPAADTTVHFVSQGAVASILHVERSEWPAGLRLKMTEPIKKELKYVLNNFLVYHLGRRLKSAKYVV